MARDHQLLVGRDHPDGDAAPIGGDARPACLVGRGIELDAQPRGVAAHRRADRGGVLADAGGEDDGRRARPTPRPAIPARARCGSRRGRPPAGRPAPATRAARACRSTPPRRRAVPTRDRAAARCRGRPCPAVSQVAAPRRIELPQRVPITSPSSAVNPMVVAMLHRPQRAHAGTVARWSTTVRPAAARGSCRKARGDVLVGQPMEAVAPHARQPQRARQRESLRERRLPDGRRYRSTPPAAGRALAQQRFTGSRLAGWCSGASGTSASSRRDTRG